MSQSLLYGEFKWVDNFDETKPFDYDWEVDLEYPKYSHKSHNDCPLAPTHMLVPRGKGVEVKN